MRLAWRFSSACCSDSLSFKPEPKLRQPPRARIALSQNFATQPTRYPRAGERPAADLDFYQQVYFHKLGTKTEADPYALGKDFPRIAEINLLTSQDGRYVMARMANGDGGEFAHYLRTPSGEWKQITRFADEISEAEFGSGEVLYLLSRHNAPMGQVL